MANTSTSSMDQLVATGMDPKAAEAIIKLVETAGRSSGVADQSRQREAARLPASKESIGWTGIIAIAAVIGIQLGAIYWLDNNMQAGFGRVYEEFGRVRGEISDLRNHTFAELGSVRAELGSVRVELGSVRVELGSVRAELGSVWTEVSMLRADVGSLQTEVGVLRSDVESLQAEVGELGGRMTNLEMLFQDRLP